MVTAHRARGTGSLIVRRDKTGRDVLMAAAGLSHRTVRVWMGHRDFKTTLIYADYQPDAHEHALAQRAFAGGVAGI